MQVNIDLTGVFNKLDNQNMDRGRYALANQALVDMNQYVPMDEGILRQTAAVAMDATAIYYNTPYARRLFYMPMRNYTTPGTGPRWDNKAKGIHMKDWKQAYMKGVGW